MHLPQVEEGSTVVKDIVYGSVVFDNTTISDQVDAVAMVTHYITALLSPAGSAEE